MKKKEALFAVIGGVVGAVLTMLAGSVVPIGAHPKASDLNVGYITCTDLRVVDGGRITVYDEHEKRVVDISAEEYGGRIVVAGAGEDKNSLAYMGNDRRGGLVAVHDKQAKTVAMMMIGDTGGRVTVIGKKEEVATLTIDGVKRSDER